jgi:SMC interacting uncharacterized protein involved in chromosome segregation
VASDIERLRSDLRALEEELERSRERLREGQEQLASLEELRGQAAGAVALARRSIEDIEGRAVEQQQALAELERLEEEQAAFAALIGQRDAAAASFAASADRALADLDALDSVRSLLGDSQRAAVQRGRRVENFMIPDEPEHVQTAWSRLTERIGSGLQQALDDELIAAAARSPMGAEIKNLPEHLQAAARERRFALRREIKLRRSRPSDDNHR